MKALAVIPLAVLLAACGSTSKRQSSSQELGPAPPSGKNGPPPAWIETKAGKEWLGFSSYCWQNGNHGVCADAIAPACGLKGIPDIAVSGGETVRAHLGYDADEASVEGSKTTLEGRVASWRIDTAGPFALFTKDADGDASYVGCARFD